MGTSKLAIFNMALGDCPADRVDLVEENSLQAITCRDHYPEALKLLLEDHDYDFAVERVTLAAVANDRSNEWRFAYQLPSDLAKPLHLLPFPADTVGAHYPRFGSYRAMEGKVPMRIANGRIYANVERAVLEFVTNAPSEARFTALFARALALELASRIVMPLLTSEKRQTALIRKAEIARERAKAADMNRDSESVLDFVSQEYLARMGFQT